MGVVLVCVVSCAGMGIGVGIDIGLVDETLVGESSDVVAAAVSTIVMGVDVTSVVVATLEVLSKSMTSRVGLVEAVVSTVVDTIGVSMCVAPPFCVGLPLDIPPF